MSFARCRSAGEAGVSITARGGGTSQAGQAIGAGVQLDFSKYLNRVLSLEPEAQRVRVEPGIVLDELNAFLRPYGLQLPLDISTSDRATIGGMIANNSSGTRSVVYGKTLDYVALAHGRAVRRLGRRAAPVDAARARREMRSVRSGRRLLSRRAPAGRASTRRRSSAAIRRSCGASAATTSMNSCRAASRSIWRGCSSARKERWRSCSMPRCAWFRLPSTGPCASCSSTTCWRRWPPRR